MTKYLLFLVFSVSTIFAHAQTKWNARYQAYVDEYKDIAIAEMLQWRIPASITLAQGILESAAGDSELSRKGNNHFGIKCHDWTGRTTYHDDDERGECFRAYDSPCESYEDHSRFLSSSQRYRSLFSLGVTDYKGWARGLKAAGYATNPKYADLLIGIIECYNLNQYDHAKTYDMAKVRNIRGGQPAGVSMPNASQHQLKMNNRCLYVIALEGDTFESLAKEYYGSARKIAKYNEASKKDKLIPGSIIYLQKKRTKADKSFKGVPHVVKRGESLYLIAQMYGIQLKSLYKINHFPNDYQLRVGDRIWVY